MASWNPNPPDDFEEKIDRIGRDEYPKGIAYSQARPLRFVSPALERDRRRATRDCSSWRLAPPPIVGYVGLMPIRRRGLWHRLLIRLSR